MKRMGAKMTQSRKKAEKALYDKFKSQEKPDMPNAFSPGSIFIKFGNKKIKKIPTVEEMMKMRERKKKTKKKAKKKAKKKNWKKISKRHKRMIRKSKKKGGRRRRRTRKKRGGEEITPVVGQIYQSKSEEDYPILQDGYRVSAVKDNHVWFNDEDLKHVFDQDDELIVTIVEFPNLFMPQQTEQPGGRKKKRRKKRTKKKRRRRR